MNKPAGCVYHEVFLLKDKAKANFMRSMALATSLQPRNFGTEGKWCCYGNILRLTLHRLAQFGK